MVKVSAWAGTRIGQADRGSNRRDPPGGQRGITVSSVYVRPDGTQLRRLARQFGDGQLEIPVAASYRLADAAQALAQVAGSHAAGAVVLTP